MSGYSMQSVEVLMSNACSPYTCSNIVSQLGACSVASYIMYVYQWQMKHLFCQLHARYISEPLTRTPAIEPLLWWKRRPPPCSMSGWDLCDISEMRRACPPVRDIYGRKGKNRKKTTHNRPSAPRVIVEWKLDQWNTLKWALCTN